MGILTPYKTYENIKDLSSSNLLDIEMHTHNDFGMATANAIAGYEAGAVSSNTTVIGIGERAGNACFEQVLMSLRLLGKDVHINSKALKALIKTVRMLQIEELIQIYQLLVKTYFHMNLEFM